VGYSPRTWALRWLLGLHHDRALADDAIRGGTAKPRTDGFSSLPHFHGLRRPVGDLRRTWAPQELWEAALGGPGLFSFASPSIVVFSRRTLVTTDGLPFVGLGLPPSSEQRVPRSVRTRALSGSSPGPLGFFCWLARPHLVAGVPAG